MFKDNDAAVALEASAATHALQQDLPESMLEQAAIWQARLRDAGLALSSVLVGDPDCGDTCADASAMVAQASSPEAVQVVAAFSRWLAQDPRHGQACREMVFVWDALAVPLQQMQADTGRQFAPVPASVPEARQGRAKRPHTAFGHGTRGWALAACLLVAVIAAGWQLDWLVRWQSDYTTAAGQTAPVLMADGSRIVLNTDSALSVDYSAQERRVRLLKGEAWFEVAPDDPRPFLLATKAGRVRVTGTRFNVQLQGDQAVVSLDSGAVELLQPDEGAAGHVALAPGQQAVMSDAGISAPEAYNRMAVHAWQRGQFVFYNAPLSEVIDTLNRYRSGRIFVAGESLGALKISGVFSTADPDAALEVIVNTLPVRQTRLTAYLVLLH